MQAVMSSDFSIAQFRYLETLLLVHGRWSYARITRMVLFFFYKNLLFGLTIFYFNCLCFFSGQTLYNGELHIPYDSSMKTYLQQKCMACCLYLQTDLTLFV